MPSHDWLYLRVRDYSLERFKRKYSVDGLEKLPLRQKLFRREAKILWSEFYNLQGLQAKFLVRRALRQFVPAQRPYAPHLTANPRSAETACMRKGGVGGQPLKSPHLVDADGLPDGIPGGTPQRPLANSEHQRQRQADVRMNPPKPALHELIDADSFAYTLHWETTQAYISSRWMELQTRRLNAATKPGPAPPPRRLTVAFPMGSSPTGYPQLEARGPHQHWLQNQLGILGEMVLSAA